MKTQTNEYDQQAEKFLTENNLEVNIVYTDKKPAPWNDSQKYGEKRHYVVTISKPDKRSISFDFWAGIKEPKKDWRTPAKPIKHPRPYDILACLSGDIQCPTDLEEFCDCYGYNPDSIKDRDLWLSANKFAHDLRRFFTEQEQEQLQEIR